MGGAVMSAVGSALGTAVAVAAGVVAPELALGYFAMNFAVSMALGAIGQALTGKPKQQSSAPQQQVQQGIMTVQRGSAEPRRCAYGRTVASGTVLFQASSGSDNKYRHLVMAMVDHAIDGVEGFFFNETFIPLSVLDGSGNVTAGAYANKARLQWKAGAEDQSAFSDLVAEVSEWTADHRGRGAFLVYGRLEWDRAVYPTGIPNIRVLFRGKKLWDPRRATVAIVSSTAATPAVFTTAAAHGLAVGDRVFLADHAGFVSADKNVGEGEHWVTAIPTATTFRCALAGKTAEVALTTGGTGGTLSKMVWSQNAALAQADYFLSPVFGMKAGLDEVDRPELIADANICDEPVGVPAGISATFTADAGTDALTPAKFINLPGDKVQVSNSGGALPAPLAAATDYWWIGAGPLAGKLAASSENALAGVAIDLTGAGTGTHIVTRLAQPRYTLCGAAVFGRQHGDIMTDLMTASGGACVYVQGMHRFRAAAYRAPVETISESFLRGPLEVDPGPGRADTFNRVKGLYVNAADNWQDADFPPITNQAWIDDEGGETIDKDLHFPFTVDQVAAQRIAGIYAQRSRQQIRVKLPCNLSALKLAVLDNVALTFPEAGFAAKEFLITKWMFGEDTVGIDLEAWEESAASYAFDPDANATWTDPAPNTTLKSPLDAPALSGLALASGTAVLGVRLDGTVFSRIKATWTAVPDAFVTSGGRIEIQCKKTADPDWLPSQFVDGAATSAFILDVIDGEAYDVRARAINILGVTSAWNTAAGHVVAGKSELPGATTGFSAAQNGTAVNFRCDKSAEADLDLIEVRRVAVGVTDWTIAMPVVNILRGDAMTSGVVPPGDWTFLAKARDTSGNYSATAARFDLTVVNPNAVVVEKPQAPDWLGTLTGFERHWTGVLVPSSTKTAAQHTREELFEAFVPYPVAECLYEAAAIDIGFDATVRLHAALAAALGRGETAGSPAPALEIDYRTAAGAYDGFEPWSVGDITARYVKARLRLTPSLGKAYVTGFTPAGDKAVTRERVATGLIVAAGGTAVTFDPRYFTAPTVEVQPIGSTARLGQPDSITATGCVARLFDPTTAAGAAGTADVYATGARA